MTVETQGPIGGAETARAPSIGRELRIDRLVTLRRRSEFLRIRGGGRWACEAFVLEGKPREPADERGPRFGFTVTKQVGGAVVRNRIRRRLKATVAAVLSGDARDGWDYVVIARTAAHDRPFVVLCDDMRTALARVVTVRPKGRARRDSRVG